MSTVMKQAIVDKLLELGITFVEATYSGGGDYGEIHHFIFKCGADEMPIGAEHTITCLVDDEEQGRVLKTFSLKDALDKVVMEQLERVDHDWEGVDSEGGFGQWNMDVSAAAVYLNLNMRSSCAETVHLDEYSIAKWVEDAEEKVVESGLDSLIDLALY